MNEQEQDQRERAQLLAEGEALKQKGLALARKYPERAREIRAILAKGEIMRRLLVEAMIREMPTKESNE